MAKVGAWRPRDAMGTGRGASPSARTPMTREMPAMTRYSGHNADHGAGRPASSGHGQERPHSRTPPTNTGHMPVEMEPWASESLVFLTENLQAMHTRDLETLGMRVAEILSSRDCGCKGKEKGHRKGGNNRKGGSGKKGDLPGKGPP